MGYKHHGVETEGLPVNYVKRFLDKFSIPVLVETGTAGGHSVRAAASLFRECHTIEIVEGRSDGDYPANVKRYYGNSPDLLPEIVKPYKHEYIFFWLDAHYSEPHESKPEVVECPVIEEIRAIKDHKKAVIMIDDARLFLAPPKWPCDYTRWPAFSAVFNTLLGNFPLHFVTVIDDYIVCIPDEMKDVLRVEWWDNQHKRFPSEEKILKDSAKLVFNEIQKYLA